MGSGQTDRLPVRPPGRSNGVLLLLVAMLSLSCAGTATLPPSPCGGSHSWPPPGYPAPPAGVTLTRLASDAVRLRNDTDLAWTGVAEGWQDLSCVGWMAIQPGARLAIPAHSSVDIAIPRNADATLVSVAVRLWDHPCPEGCTDPPTGFAYGDLPGSS